MTNLELWNTLALGLTSLVAMALFYIWTALALAAVFRKSGEAGWKAWVPILNSVVLLQVAGLSGWLVLLFLVPIAGFIVLIVATYRINVAFGHGAGMTVLAALLFPVWATVLGFGPDRWVGREGAPRGPVRTGSADLPFPGAAPGSDPFASIAPPPAYIPAAYPAARPEVPGAPTATTPPPPVPTGLTLAAGWTPPPLPSRPASAAAAAAMPPLPPVPADEEPVPARPALPESARAAFPEPEPSPARSAFAEPIQAPTWADDASLDAAHAEDDELDDEGAPATPRRSTAAAGQPEWELPDEAPEPSWDFDFGPASATSEVTDAVTGAPAPVSAAPVRGRPADDAPSAPPVPPPVTRVPASPAPAALREPWAPAPSPVPTEGEAFPESSGPVSAIAGAPDAGGPRSARSSVSAMHTRPHIPEEDELEATVVARRKRTAWTLTGPTGARIPLTAEVVLLGRRPSPDPAFPDAQLVSLDDDTRTISKTHARLELRDDKWYITDLDSTNGVLFTTLMGTEIAATPGEATEAGETFLLGDAEVSLSRSDG